MNFKICVIIISSFFNISQLTAQEMEFISLEYKHSLRIERKYVKIELVKNANEYTLLNVCLDKKDFIDLFKNIEKKKVLLQIDSYKFSAIKKMIEQFDSKAKKKKYGDENIQDGVSFILKFGNKTNTKTFESNIGLSFKTKNPELKAFSEICKQILLLANYKWRKLL